MLFSVLFNFFLRRMYNLSENNRTTLKYISSQHNFEEQSWRADTPQYQDLL